MEEAVPTGSAFGELFVIADGGLGTVAGLEEELGRRGLPYRLAHANPGGEAEGMASQALRAGHRFLVAVGGDELVNEVVNGMFEGDSTIVQRPVLGIIPAGRRIDVSKTFGLPEETSRACAHLTRRSTYSTDVVRASAIGRGGEPVTRWFVNLARIGLWAAADARGARTRLGRVGRLLAFWRTVAGFRPTHARIAADRRVVEARVHDIVLGNCQFVDGMKLSPRSYPGDGVLDVQVFRGPLSEAYSLIWRIARGEHLPSPRVVELRAKRHVSVEAERPLVVEVDGRMLGTTPAGFEVFPQAIQVKL